MKSELTKEETEMMAVIRDKWINLAFENLVQALTLKNLKRVLNGFIKSSYHYLNLKLFIVIVLSMRVLKLPWSKIMARSWKTLTHK